MDAVIRSEFYPKRNAKNPQLGTFKLSDDKSSVTLQIFIPTKEEL